MREIFSLCLRFLHFQQRTHHYAQTSHVLDCFGCNGRCHCNLARSRVQRRLLELRLPRLRRGPVGCSDTNATAWVNAVTSAGGTVSGTQATNVCNLIVAYKAAGVFTLLDREWLYASENATQASIDIVNLSTHALSGTPTFTTNRGYAFGGVEHIDTNYTPGTNFTLNGLSFGEYATVVAGGTAVGFYGPYSYTKPASAGNVEYDADEVSFFAAPNKAGLAAGNYIITRTSSTSVSIYQNAGVAIQTSTAGPNTLPSGHFFTGAANNGSGTATDLFVGTLASVFFGGALNSTQAPAKSAALNTYMTAVGANVY
jgi:hypothetical protein